MRNMLLIVLAAAAACAPGGCSGDFWKDNAWTASRDKSYEDDVQGMVQEKLHRQREAPADGQQRWEATQANEYQGDDHHAIDLRSEKLEASRHAAADELLSGPPLELSECLACCLEFNDAVQAAIALLRGTEGLELIANSRFLPSLSYGLTATVSENVTRNFSHGGLALMELIEFGRDHPLDVALRADQRQSLFTYENVVAAALSDVRVRFYTILLKKRQLAERERLRDEFIERYERIVKLEEARRVPGADVLTARLNVLNEQRRIGSLRSEIVRLKMDLLNAMGLPVGMTEFDVAGELEEYDFSRQQSMDIAYRRSTEIAQARASLWESNRRVRQSIWDYAPDVRMQGGYAGHVGRVGADLSSFDNTYGFSGFAERPVRGSLTDLPTSSFIKVRADDGWFWGVDLLQPVFTGLRRTGQFKVRRSAEDFDRHFLAATIQGKDRAVGQAYQTVLEEAGTAEILEETVQISKERLSVQERLKDLGKVTDSDLETFRQRFFADQDELFEQQLRLVVAQERLRLEMRYFEPAALEGSEDVDNESDEQ